MYRFLILKLNLFINLCLKQLDQTKDFVLTVLEFHDFYTNQWCNLFEMSGNKRYRDLFNNLIELFH